MTGKQVIVMFRLFISVLLLVLSVSTVPAASPESLCTRRIERSEIIERGWAIDACTEVLKKNPDSIVARLYRARNLYWEGKYDAARADFERILRQDPRQPAALFGRAQILLDHGEFEDAAVARTAAIAASKARKNAIDTEMLIQLDGIASATQVFDIDAEQYLGLFVPVAMKCAGGNNGQHLEMVSSSPDMRVLRLVTDTLPSGGFRVTIEIDPYDNGNPSTRSMEGDARDRAPDPMRQFAFDVAVAMDTVSDFVCRSDGSMSPEFRQVLDANDRVFSPHLPRFNQ